MILTSRDYYDQLSQEYDHELAHRAAYVKAINDLVIELSVSMAARTIIDVGCGNGTRLQRILGQTELAGVGIDESPRMIAEARERGVEAQVVDIAAPLNRGALPCQQFDLAIALWNVLGHIPRREERVAALRNMRSLMGPGGAIVFDVNNRYNAAHYGWWRAGRNWLRDRMSPQRSGDFTVQRTISGSAVATVVHVFSLREVRALCSEAGLQPAKIHFIDYLHGKPVRGQWAGQLCVVAKATE